MFNNPVKYKGIVYPVGAKIPTGVIEDKKEYVVETLKETIETKVETVVEPITEEAPKKQLVHMNKAELTELATELGITLNGDETNKAIVTLIKAKQK